MPLRTAKQSTTYIIGEDGAAVTLTAAFSGNVVSFPTEMYDGMKLYIDYTPAQNGRECTIQAEYSPDGTNYYIDTVESQESTGNSDLLSWQGTVIGATASTSYKRAYRVPVDSSYVRISVKEDGVATFGTAVIQAEFKIN
jgi:hypothetical protein